MGKVPEEGGYSVGSSVIVTTAASCRITTINSMTLMCRCLECRDCRVG